MHKLKKALDEIENMQIPQDCTFLPNDMFESGLTFEELSVYMHFCYLKSNGLEMPPLSEFAEQIQTKEAMLKITLAALEEKGITLEK